MANEQYTAVGHTIKSRRSVSWAKMNGKKIDDETVMELLHLAHWAPTHGRTEPWLFYVYTGEAMAKFAEAHANLYWEHTDAEKRMEGTREKLKHNTDLASHLVVAVMKRGQNEKIPVIEEVAAASAAIQNILLGATAMGIASFWSTGGMALKPALAQYLGLGAEDAVLGLIFLGYTDEPAKEGLRNSHINDKVKWVK